MVLKEGGHYVKANKDDTNKMEHGVHCDSDDSKDSDTLQLFELPKRKLVRPISSTLRRKVHETSRCWSTTKECCRVFASVTVPMLVAVFVVSTVLCLAFLLVGIAGMKQEISILKSRIKNFDAAEKNFLEKKEELRKQFQDKLQNMNEYQNELQLVTNAVNKVYRNIDGLNKTIQGFHKKPTPGLSSKVNELRNDLETVKTGMADTGSDIEKLKANGKSMIHNVRLLKQRVDAVRRQLYNMTVKVSLLENKVPPPFMKPSTTPKMLVVTITPDQNQPVPRKELNKILKELEKRQIDHCTKEVAAYDKRLVLLANITHHMHDEYMKEINSFRKFMDSFHLSTTEVPTTAVVNVSHVSNSTLGVQTTVRSKNIPMPPHNDTVVISKTLNHNLSRTLNKTSKDHHGALSSTQHAFLHNNATVRDMSSVSHTLTKLPNSGSILHNPHSKESQSNKTKT